ncbi:Kinase [Zostera marina]|uniref:Kinase n=1 Tax=Zostera marina TaxID=29655 RepID=A0A0K9PR07_ZOSMR|nr:Kinase [Zostera marina]
MRGGRVAYERPWMETGINTNLSVESNQVMNAENEIPMTKVKESIPPTPSRSVIPFSVASLQQYTDSFSEANIILEDKLGKIYRADIPDGKKLMVMKIDIRESTLSNDEFRNLAFHVFELQHPNILELIGYCTEYGQRLLVYTYFSGRTLHDILHDENDIKRKLSWNARIEVALGAARALEYLHEGCQSPIIHQKFESSSILLDNELSVCVCDCGLASISSPSNSVSQISRQMQSLFSYEPPEIRDSGTHSDRSDVYSFGVVMLELLTGREPYDSSRPRAEQYLVRWASTQLHDINTLKRMVDSSIAGKYPVKSLSRFADIISRCIQEGSEFRPPISEVVQDLSRMVQVIKTEDEKSHGKTD